MKSWLTPVFLLIALSGLSQQPRAGSHDDVHVIESRYAMVCDPAFKPCTITQQLVVTVGTRKLELWHYQNQEEGLIALGTYPGQLVLGKKASSYRIDESYILTYPDGKTEKFQVVSILQE